MSYATAKKHAKEGRLKAHKIGRLYRVTRSDLDTFVGVESTAPKVEEPEPTSREQDFWDSMAVLVSMLDEAGEIGHALLKTRDERLRKAV